MAAFHHGSDSSSAEKFPVGEQKLPYEHGQYDSHGHVDVTGLSDPLDENHSLHRGLSARQVSMIAIGGAIGTGLIIGKASQTSILVTVLTTRRMQGRVALSRTPVRPPFSYPTASWV